MIVTKSSNYSSQNKYSRGELYDRQLDYDVQSLFTCLQGRVKLSDNIGGAFVTYTSNATPDTEDTVTHNLGVIPKGFLVIYQTKAGSAYQGPTTGTAWSTTKMYLKCNVASVTFYLFVLK